MKKTAGWIELVAVTFFASISATQPVIAGTVTDGFEGSSLSSFWTSSGPGSEALTSAVAYSGNQSVFLQVSPSFPWNAELSHDYGSQQVGTVSVFMQVPAGPNSSAADLEVDGSGVTLADIQENSDGTFFGRILPSSSGLSFSYTPSSPNGWNLLSISTLSSGTTLSIDGTTIGSSSLVTSFQAVSLQNWGGPSGGAYFDDFSSTTSNAPEPASAYLLALGGLTFAVSAGLRRREKSKC